MRRVISILTVVVASVLISGSTLLADERLDYATPENGKDVCLLIAMNCANEVDSIQMRIERLNNEIAKGTDVYTKEELNTLKNELQDAIRNQEVIVSGG